MKNIFHAQDVYRFFAVVLLFLIVAKLFTVESFNLQPSSNIESIKAKPVIVNVTNDQTFNIQDEISTLEIIEPKEMPSFDFSSWLPLPDSIENKAPSIKPEQVTPSEPSIAIPKPVWDGKERAKIAIIIDDMGLSRSYTKQVIDLPSPMTLAFLPYAPKLDNFIETSQAKDHELIIHVPMEPMNPDLDLGPAGLTTDLNKSEFLQRLDEDILDSFNGYVGINNHMGSKLTQNKRAMNWLMQVLKEKDLFFVDSKTIHTSIAAKTAHQYGVDYAERDVFLDHHDSLEEVLKSLSKLEKVAKRNGRAIAIGHPKKNTIEALRLWMPSIKDRGLELVPVSDLIQKFQKKEPASAALILNSFDTIPGRPESAVLKQALPPG